jgi:type I restriction enzyme M protein
MPQLEHIEAIEKRLWNAADTLRANSNYASNEYFLPVMGLIFLRHAYSRYLAVRESIEANLPKRGGKARKLTPADFSQKGSLFLRPIAQFDYLVALTDGDDRARAIIAAMQSIEDDYASLNGVLPKAEYQELDNPVLGQLLRTLNPDELKNVSGDIFGRIYEYFLTGFANLKAHDNGEFFTPVSLVSLIANVIEPAHGIVLDPACGSGGMFVQSAHFVERLHANPTERLTFCGMEKNPTTIRLAKMNLAVHGLEGDIQKAITYYEDPHELAGQADFVMANPPFNVDEVDADKIKRDPRLPFGLPGVNKSGKVSNGNYLWISYFYSYLNARGRAGFVMSSQASSAGRDEATVRRKLIETGAVEVMIAIRSNFFYTRTVPCELWFLDRAKPAARKDKVLMLDARNIYRKVTRKIYDFSPEQLQNILAIIWLARGEGKRFADLVAEYEQRALAEARACVEGDAAPVPAYLAALQTSEVFKTSEVLDEFARAVEAFRDLTGLRASDLPGLADASRELIKQADALYKQATPTLKAAKTLRVLDAAREAAVEQLKLVRYFHKQAVWLTTHFPDGKFRDVPGLCRLVDKQKLEANDWSLTPGRYVGVAPEEVDDEFDFEATLRDIHVELQDLNAQAVELAATIARNFEGLGI